MFDQPITAQLSRKPIVDSSHTEPLLELKGVETRGEGAATSLKDINLVVYPGEIVGIAGVSGNGQKELGDLVLGMERVALGHKLLFSKETSNVSVGSSAQEWREFYPRKSTQHGDRTIHDGPWKIWR